MQEKDTNDLENVLGKTHLADYDSYVQKNKASLLSESNSFSTYVKEKIAEKGITQQAVFLKAGIRLCRIPGCDCYDRRRHCIDRCQKVSK